MNEDAEVFEVSITLLVNDVSYFVKRRAYVSTGAIDAKDLGLARHNRIKSVGPIKRVHESVNVSVHMNIRACACT